MSNFILCNAFSLQMLNLNEIHNIKITPLTKIEFDELMENNTVVSAVGHQDTANVLGVECNRVNVSLDNDTVLLVAQITGGRLPEGTTELPEGFEFQFVIVELGCDENA